MIERSKSFMVAADEVWRLQRDDDPECRAFRRMVLGHERPSRGTMQGTYVFAPGGRLLARRNSNSAEVILELMGDALEAWEKSKAPSETRADAGKARPRGRWEDSYPDDGLVLLRTVRDLPGSGVPEGERDQRFNRDALWFSRKEARHWLPADLRTGARHDVPSSIVERLARLSLVDNARGQTIPYHASEVAGSFLRTEVTSVRGDVLELLITGETRARAKGPWLLGQNCWKPAQEHPHGLHTAVYGTATFDKADGRFSRFELVALGERYGRTVMSGRRSDAPPGPIGFVLEIAPREWRIAPTFIDMYDVDWVRHPESPRRGPGRSFAVTCWVQTTRSGESFPALVSDKAWDGGEIKDFTSRHALGRSRSSGSLRGFSLALQPNGSWTWNMGDGARRLDYRPTNERQPVNDGKLHLLGFSMDRQRNECRLYHDGICVAVYSTAGLGRVRPDRSASISAMEGTAFTLHSGPLADEAVAGIWTRRTGTSVPDRRSSKRLESIKVLAWNIWHGGRRDGDAAGLEKTIQVIRETGADVICMQETYGSGAAIADALGFQLHLRSSNLSVMSRYPIRETHDVYQPFRLGGATIELSPGQHLKAFSLWINHLPDVGRFMREDQVDVEGLLAAEERTRGKEIRGILATLEPHMRAADRIPIIVAGDFNSSSHLDWTELTAGAHKGLVVPWPVSLAMQRHGFEDVFRRVYPDPHAMPGRTWSPRFRDAFKQRIDYVYFMGRTLTARAASMLDRHARGWPSDHAAVLATMELTR